METSYQFSNQKGKSYYYNTIKGFLNDKSSTVLGLLVKKAFDNNDEQRDAWINQIAQLQEKLTTYNASGHIIFEYDIVRLGKRIDVVLLMRHIVFSLEFKNGKNVYVAKDVEQAEDYALDLKNFHKESENLYVCPILIATNAKNFSKNVLNVYKDGEIYLQYANSNTMMNRIEAVIDKYGNDEDINFDKWYNSPYFPTPTIIQAAVEAYQNNTVEEIAHSEAGQDGINKCEKTINSIIDNAIKTKEKCICFITGVPGAGKTLVGLDIACKNQDKKSGRYSVYLSGNGPLVSVLRSALAKNAHEHGMSTKESKASVKTLIQGIHEFRKDALLNSNQPTHEKIVIFDEAQRCWDQQHLNKWAKRKQGFSVEMSEPQFLIDTMNRQKDWAVIICLVGLGQDIYNGEAGINEWFRSSINDFHNWHIYYSPEIFNQVEDKDIDKDMILNTKKATMEQSLHLQTSIRSFRSNKQSQFIDSILDLNPKQAKSIYEELSKKYPVFITRDISKAKSWARNNVRGSERCGIVACSSAQRLKPDGVYVPKDIDVDNWFLAPKDDLRSSNALEVVASEFKIQGLEIDWAIVCWDADLRYSEGQWEFYNFKGTNWQKRNSKIQKRYLLNAYRVLLTRARQGMTIFIPIGCDPAIDKTRNSKYYDSIYHYLHVDCGIEELK